MPSELELDFTAKVEPRAVIDTREVTKKGHRVEEWLVHWKIRPIEEVTWENATAI